MPELSNHPVRMCLKNSQVFFIILAGILLLVECRKEVWTCETKDDQECVFPFVYNGTTYENCSTIFINSKAWCATETDGDDMMVKFGECDLDSCEYVKRGGFNMGGLIGAFAGVGVAMGASLAYMKKRQKGCFKNRCNKQITTIT